MKWGVSEEVQAEARSALPKLQASLCWPSEVGALPQKIQRPRDPPANSSVTAILLQKVGGAWDPQETSKIFPEI